MIKLNKWGIQLLGLCLILLMLFTGCSNTENSTNKEQSTDKINPEQIGPPTMTYLGHASVKIKTSNGLVVYIDPAFGEDYSEPADIVFITHYHSDHGMLEKISDEKKYKLIRPEDALKDSVYQEFDVMGINVKSVPAYNSNHSKSGTVGYILEFDGIKLYHAGDTSKIKEMDDLASENITYALLPMDGIYNMGPEEAMEVANIIKAKNYIPIHTGADGVYSEENIAKFKVDNKMIFKPGEKLELKK